MRTRRMTEEKLNPVRLCVILNSRFTIHKDGLRYVKVKDVVNVLFFFPPSACLSLRLKVLIRYPSGEWGGGGTRGILKRKVPEMNG